MLANKIDKTHTDSIKVKHNKTDNNKDKIIDYLESVSLTKPVDRIHTSSLVIMGKKTKKNKKKQKNIK